MVCDTCDHCPGDEETDRESEAKLIEFVQQQHEHGIQSGLEIAKLVKEIHPNAAAVIPLYRSCIAIVQDEQDSKDGTATIHAYGDPNWLGGKIDIETLKSDRFHKIHAVQGLREGPEIINLENQIGEGVNVRVDARV